MFWGRSSLKLLVRVKYLVSVGTCTLLSVVTLRGISPLGVDLCIVVRKKNNQDTCWGRKGLKHKEALCLLFSQRKMREGQISLSPWKRHSSESKETVSWYGGSGGIRGVDSVASEEVEVRRWLHRRIIRIEHCRVFHKTSIGHVFSQYLQRECPES